jgi:hypothetical protein
MSDFPSGQPYSPPPRLPALRPLTPVDDVDEETFLADVHEGTTASTPPRKAQMAVLILAGYGPQLVNFERRAPDLADGETFVAVAVERHTWEELGRPDEITITIAPGNLVGG